MGTTYYVNRSANLFGTYVCSKCRSIVLIQFALKSGGASTWSQAKAVDAMEEASNKVLMALQEFPEKPFLVSKTYEGRTFTTGYEIGMEHPAKACPYCGNRETWQNGAYYADACTKDPETGVPLVADVPVESRMRVFTSLEAAKNAISIPMSETDAQYIQHWKDHPEDAQTVKEQIGALKEYIGGLEAQKAAAKDASKYIMTQVEQKEAEMKGYSLFSAEKKTAKAELKELKKQYDAQLAIDQEQENALNAEIKTYKKQLKDMHIAYPAVLGEVETVTAKGLEVHMAIRLN